MARRPVEMVRIERCLWASFMEQIGAVEPVLDCWILCAADSEHDFCTDGELRAPSVIPDLGA